MDQLYEDLFGRGPGDPDVWGYPGEQAKRPDDYTDYDDTGIDPNDTDIL